MMSTMKSSILARRDVAKAVGVTRVHKAALEHTAQSVHQKAYADLTADEQEEVEEEAEEWYLTYVFCSTVPPSTLS